jgi:hypothetical protein
MIVIERAGINSPFPVWARGGQAPLRAQTVVMPWGTFTRARRLGAVRPFGRDDINVYKPCVDDLLHDTHAGPRCL